MALVNQSAATDVNLTQDQLIRLEALNQAVYRGHFREAKDRSTATILRESKMFERFIRDGEV